MSEKLQKVLARQGLASRREIETRVREVEKVETAIDESFQDHFVDALGIPHASHTFPMLSRLVSLPRSSSASAMGKRKRRRKAPVIKEDK